MIAKDKVIVMIMGVDEREGDVGRSDTLMVATLDPKKKKAAILSIPRDTRVKIRGNGFDKINAAYAYGGYHLTKDTVENLLGVEMEHYVLINVKSFKKIIDAIGGVEINVEKRMYYEDVWDDDGGLLINLYPGMQHMDGNTAITYVRYRDEEGDIGRIARQQKFMQAVMDKITSPAIASILPSNARPINSPFPLRTGEPELPNTDLTELKQAFDLFDHDGSQKIKIKECLEGMKSINFDKTNPILFDIIKDLENNEWCSWPKFAFHVYTSITDRNTDDGLRTLFDLFIDDPEKDTISLDTFRRICQEVGENMSDDELKNILEITTQSGNEISFEDFCQYMRLTA